MILDEPNERASQKGYIQVYIGRRRFTAHLAGEQQTMDVQGTWKREGDRLMLEFKELKFDDFGGEAVREPSKRFLAISELRKLYARPLVLDLSEDHRKLEGLPISVGGFAGRHVFSR